MKTSRRTFVTRAGLALAGGAVLADARSAESHSDLHRTERPLIVSTWPFSRAANETALKVMSQGGSLLDGVEQGIWVTETSGNSTVGLSGRPNAAGVVQLDACMMYGPGHQAGGVAALEGIVHPISAARRVMERTPNVLLVGEGARLFALEQGLKSVPIDSAARYAAWARQHGAERPHPKSPPPGKDNHDTITMLVLGADGNLAGGCSTSGLANKLPGRVGDSPIAGDGLYVDNEIGAAGSTGLGENVMRYCGSFLVVELMRQGHHPAEACREALRRMARHAPRGPAGLSVSFVALDKQGRFGAATAGERFEYVVTTASGSQTLQSPELS